MAVENFHLDLRITGKVQGVWYRKTAVEMALHLGIVGYAMNMPDGSVRIAAEGTRDQLDMLVAWCRIGPPLAMVDGLEVIGGELIGFTVFETHH